MGQRVLCLGRLLQPTTPLPTPFPTPPTHPGGHLSHGYQTDTKKISATSIFFEVGAEQCCCGVVFMCLCALLREGA